MKYLPEVTGGYMKYLSEVTVDGVTYEAWVDVHDDGDAEFSTRLAYLNDTVCTLSDVPDVVMDDLLDAAIDMYRADDGADAAYEAWRDA
jgi:hypothetical protein